MLVPKHDTRRLTYADYLQWPDDLSGELIEGIAYIREPPGPSELHQELVGELYYQVRAALEGRPHYRVYVAPLDVRLPKSTEPDEQVDTVVQPDVFVVCDRRKLDERGARRAPDWVVEVLSPSTARHDRVIKVPVYERRGVAEVWLIQPTDRKVSLYRLAGGQYGPPTVLELKGKTAVTSVPGISVDWDRILERLQ